MVTFRILPVLAWCVVYSVLYYTVLATSPCTTTEYNVVGHGQTLLLLASLPIPVLLPSAFVFHTRNNNNGPLVCIIKMDSIPKNIGYCVGFGCVPVATGYVSE